MKRPIPSLLLVVALTTAAASALFAYREYCKDNKLSQTVNIVQTGDLGESLRRQFVGHTAHDLFRHYSVEFKDVILEQEPPGELASATFVAIHNGGAFRIRAVFSDEDGQPSHSLLHSDWTKSFVESLKIRDIEVHKAQKLAD